MWAIVMCWGGELIGCVFLYKGYTVYSNYDIRYSIVLVYVMSAMKMTCEGNLERNTRKYEWV